MKRSFLTNPMPVSQKGRYHQRLDGRRATGSFFLYCECRTKLLRTTTALTGEPVTISIVISIILIAGGICLAVRGK
jgi:hypothetical protein